MGIALSSWESLNPWHADGVAAHVTELAAGLQRRGHDVHVLTRPMHGSRSAHRFKGLWYHFYPYDLARDLTDEGQTMCRSFIDVGQVKRRYALGPRAYDLGVAHALRFLGYRDGGKG